ncbi:MAG: hypothetical protein WDW36_004484 [Sanguina aurantia]
MGKRRGGGRGGGRGGDEDGGGGRSRGIQGEDQYGETFKSQDRDGGANFSRGGMTGGGSAGGSGRGGKGGGMNITYQRVVPKFLQKLSHLLPQPAPNEDEPATLDDPVMAKKRSTHDEGSGSGSDGDGAEDPVEMEALQRAMEENPELAREFGDKFSKQLGRHDAAKEKERGNAAFAAKKYEEAVRHFTRCITLDPGNEVYHSNRSAAHASCANFEAALTDAQQAVALKPRWAKAHARAGAAFLGLKLYSEASAAYEKAMNIEPDDQSIQRSLEQAELLEQQEAREGKHTFKRHRGIASGGSSSAATIPDTKPLSGSNPAGGGMSLKAEESGDGVGGGVRVSRKQASELLLSSRGTVAAAGVKNKQLLSFSAEDEDQ